MGSVKIDKQNCSGCGLCVESCPRNVFELDRKNSEGSEKVSQVSNENACFMCFACLAACKNNCITLIDSSSEMII